MGFSFSTYVSWCFGNILCSNNSVLLILKFIIRLRFIVIYFYDTHASGRNIAKYCKLGNTGIFFKVYHYCVKDVS